MSEIGKRLGQSPADEIREIIYRPQIASVDEDDFNAMIALNKAHCVMLAECGLVDLSTAQTLLRGMLQLEKQGIDTKPVNTLLEDAYFAFEMRLASVVGEHIAGSLHLARSRNDIGATLDRMRARTYTQRIVTALLAVREICVARAEQYVDTLMPGYTHLQPAQPVSYGYYLSGYEVALERDSQRIIESYHHTNQNALGVAALAGSSFSINRHRTAELLGFDGVTRHGLDTIASRDFVLSLLGSVNLLGVTWSRLAEDYLVFVTSEFALLQFPDNVAGISSIMPQKKNPIALEYMKAQSARILGAYTGCIAAVRSTHFSVALDAMREGLTDAWQILKRIPDDLSVLQLIISSAAPLKKELKERCDTNFSTATDLADGLVKTYGLSFREAHHIVGAAVRIAIANNQDATGITTFIIDQAAEAVIGHALHMPAAFIHECLDAKQALLSRTTEGGASPQSVQHTLAVSRQRIQATRQVLQGWQSQQNAANERLNAAVLALLESK